eukprot:TRINITY_DN13975_c0_g2_i4.p1 TRINITY_DN13975_c0_g2~~TRINITY_DN13975_c0_g2_i4.p1  ORF type:complete len:201 (-),score=36.25 TRINITY_DN13975_c0_g2_i4:611-1213(-)
MHVVYRWPTDANGISESSGSDQGTLFQEESTGDIIVVAMSDDGGISLPDDGVTDLAKQQGRRQGQQEEEKKDDDQEQPTEIIVCPHCLRNHDSLNRPNKLRRERFKIQLQAIHDTEDEGERAALYVKFLELGAYACKLMQASGVDLELAKRRASDLNLRRDYRDPGRQPSTFESTGSASSPVPATSSSPGSGILMHTMTL